MKLNQVVANEKAVKARTYSDVSDLHKTCQKVTLFNGLTKNYQAKHEDGEVFPSESERVQQRVPEILAAIRTKLIEAFDATATKDYGNMLAKADVTVAGEVIVKDAPVPFLLYLEKQLTDLRTFFEKLPTLDEATDWLKSENNGLYESPVVQTIKTKKVQKPIVLYAATPEHPAQTQIITDDQTVGVWLTTKLSGAIKVTERQALVDRLDLLLDAVRIAREAANNTDVEKQLVGADIFRFLLP